MLGSDKHTLQNTASARSSDSQFYLYPEEDFELSSSSMASQVSSESLSQKQDRSQQCQTRKRLLSPPQDLSDSGLISHFKKLQEREINGRTSRNMRKAKLRFKSEINFKNLSKDHSFYDDTGSIKRPKYQLQKSLLNLTTEQRSKADTITDSLWSLGQTQLEYEPVRAEDQNQSLLSGERELELQALNALDSISDLPILDEKNNFIIAAHKSFNQKRRDATSARRLKKPALLSPNSSRGSNTFKVVGSGWSDMGKKSCLKIPTIFPDSLSPWTQEASNFEPLEIFSQKSKSNGKPKQSFKRQLNLQEYIQEYPLSQGRNRNEDKSDMNHSNPQSDTSLPLESKMHPEQSSSRTGLQKQPWKGHLQKEDRITQEASPNLPDEASRDETERQQSLKRRGLDQLFQKYQDIVSQSERIKDNLRSVKPLKLIKLKETYVQRPKYWKFKKDNSPKLQRNEIENTGRNTHSLMSCFSPSRKELSVNGSKMKMKKGNYSVNIDGYLSDKMYENTENQYSPYSKRPAYSYTSEVRSPRKEEEFRTITARSQIRQKSLLMDRKISQFTQSTQVDDRSEDDLNRSIEFKPLLKAEDLRQRSYPFKCDSRLSSSFTISSQDSLFEDIEGKVKRVCPTSLFKPFEKGKEGRILGSSSFYSVKESTRASRSRESSREPISKNLKIKSKARFGGGVFQSSDDQSSGWSTPDRHISRIVKSKFDKTHTKMLASFNQSLRQRKPGKLG